MCECMCGCEKSDSLCAYYLKKNTGLHVVVLLLKEGSCITYNVTLCIMYKCRYTAK